MILEIWLEEADSWGGTYTRFLDVEVRRYVWGQNQEIEEQAASLANLSPSQNGETWRVARIELKKSGRVLFVDNEKAPWEPEDVLDI